MTRRRGLAHSAEIPYEVTTAEDRTRLYTSVGSDGIMDLPVARRMRKLGLDCSCPAKSSLFLSAIYILTHTAANQALREHTKKVEYLTSMYRKVRDSLRDDQLWNPVAFSERLRAERWGIEDFEDQRNREYAQVTASYQRWKLQRDKEHRDLSRRGKSICDWSYGLTEAMSLDLSERPGISTAVEAARTALKKCLSDTELVYLDDHEDYDDLDLDLDDDDWESKFHARRSRR